MWLHALGVVSLASAVVCAAVLIVALVRHPQPMWIMNLVWPITALYFGPLAVWWYIRLGRAGHHHEARPFRQTVIVETTHCGAGCTLGDVIAEFTIFLVPIVIVSNSLVNDYIGDFVLAYLFGVLFQYFAIAPMRNLALLPGLWAAIQADTISLIAFEVGLFAWMAVMMHMPFADALTPREPAYWFLMQIGMAIGFVTSYPANWYLVRKGIKKPM